MSTYKSKSLRNGTIRLLHWKCFGYILADGNLSFQASYCFSVTLRSLSQFRVHTHSSKEVTHRKDGTSMSIEDNKAFTRRAFDPFAIILLLLTERRIEHEKVYV